MYGIKRNELDGGFDCGPGKSNAFEPVTETNCGDMQARMLQLDRARASCEAALNHAREAADANPNDVDTVRQVAVVHERLEAFELGGNPGDDSTMHFEKAIGYLRQAALLSSDDVQVAAELTKVIELDGGVQKKKR